MTGLESVIINGYSKTKISDVGRRLTKSDHAWNAVKIEDKWIMIDVTWGAGYVNRDQFIPSYSAVYFNTPSELFDLKHFPQDTTWLFSNISKKEFIEGPLYFREYLEADLEILSPNKGTIEVKDESEIKIKISSDTVPKGISYNFNNEIFGNSLKFEKEGKHYVSKIPLTKNKAFNLMLFYKNQSILAYRIKYTNN